MATLASVSDLSVRLKVTAPAVNTADYNQMVAALEDASGEMRSIIGQDITPGETEWTCRVPVGGVIVMPSVPVTAVASVTVKDTAEAVQFVLEDSHTVSVSVAAGTQVIIAYSYGWATIPADIKKWTCVLAAAQLAAAAAGNLGLSGGIAGLGVDDGRISFATASNENGMGVMMPEAQEAKLRAAYGSNATNAEHRP